MNHQYVEKIFLQFANKDTQRVMEDSYIPALQALGINYGKEQLFAEVDLDNDVGLELDEFNRVIRQPSVLESWCSTLPLAKLLASCIMSVRSSNAESSDPVRDQVSTLSSEVLHNVADEFRRGIGRFLKEKVIELQRCYEELDKKAAESSDGSNSKFTFDFSAGSADDFHAGLTDRVGDLLALI